MSSLTKTLQIDGMTCVSCENKIERKLLSTKGITNSKVSYYSKTAIVMFDESVISLEKIVLTIEQLDYKAVQAVQKNNQKTDITKILGVGIVILALYMVINRFGVLTIFNTFPQAEEGMGYGILFIIGLITSLHCVAMCGGINLSQCVPQKIDGSTYEGKPSILRPSTLYNVGRVIS